MKEKILPCLFCGVEEKAVFSRKATKEAFVAVGQFIE